MTVRLLEQESNANGRRQSEVGCVCCCQMQRITIVQLSKTVNTWLYNVVSVVAIINRKGEKQKDSKGPR